jgi:hypothetical protein
MEESREDDENGVFTGEKILIEDIPRDKNFGSREDGLEVVTAVVGVFWEEGERLCERVQPLHERSLCEVGGCPVWGFFVERSDSSGEFEEFCGHGFSCCAGVL